MEFEDIIYVLVALIAVGAGILKRINNAFAKAAKQRPVQPTDADDDENADADDDEFHAARLHTGLPLRENTTDLVALIIQVIDPLDLHRKRGEPFYCPRHRHRCRAFPPGRFRF